MICPEMSRPNLDVEMPVYFEFVECQEHKCRLWIEVYTTEGERVNGCAKELGPRMHEGLLRV